MKHAIRQAQAAILRYLAEYQDARDTLEHIEKWWLPEARDYSIADVREALEILAGRHLVKVWNSASVRPLYGRGTADAREFEEYLRSIE